MKKIIVKRNRYADSVMLMSVGENARKRTGAESAEALMCTQANRELLESEGYHVPAEAGANDLVLAASGSDAAVAAAISSMEEELNRGRKAGKTYHTLDDEGLEAYSIVQISLPGEYAGKEAKKALEKGHHVFLFSDNVPIAEERALKEYAVQHGLLCMGPDCGVAQIGGVALGAGSILSAGRVGIVGASGSGAQEVACLIEAMGEGISELIGTGGRDLLPEIGGIVMQQGMRLLEEDPRTELIVLVSKLADRAVMKRVLELADGMKKPVVAVFLGADESLFRGHRTEGAYSLEEAAVKAVERLGGGTRRIGFSEERLETLAKEEIAKYSVCQKYLRGLYCGGTFTEEGLIYYAKACPDTQFYSNLNTKYAKKLPDKEESIGHTVLDLGAEDFTADAPHPVFEPELRLRRLRRELADEEVAIVTLDFITGPGVHEDPAGLFLKEIEKSRESGRHVTLIANVCGSKLDPQNVAGMKEALSALGVIVMDSNIETARLAARILVEMKEKRV